MQSHEFRYGKFGWIVLWGVNFHANFREVYCSMHGSRRSCFMSGARVAAFLALRRELPKG